MIRPVITPVDDWTRRAQLVSSLRLLAAIALLYNPYPHTLTRRQSLAHLGALCAVLAIGRWPASSNAPGRLLARPRRSMKTAFTGTRTLALDPARNALLRVPEGVTTPMPLMLALHGATQRAEWMLNLVGDAAAAAGIAVLAPQSMGVTWDAIRGTFGVDASFIDRALQGAFDLVSVDAARVAICGFSDGASYALSLGLMNGDLFPRIVAFSPGFLVEGPLTGHPGIFISHGRRDPILDIDATSRRLVVALRENGYPVTYREFDGGHSVPDAIKTEALGLVASVPSR